MARTLSSSVLYSTEPDSVLGVPGFLPGVTGGVSTYRTKPCPQGDRHPVHRSSLFWIGLLDSVVFESLIRPAGELANSHSRTNDSLTWCYALESFSIVDAASGSGNFNNITISCLVQTHALVLLTLCLCLFVWCGRAGLWAFWLKPRLEPKYNACKCMTQMTCMIMVIWY